MKRTELTEVMSNIGAIFHSPKTHHQTPVPQSQPHQHHHHGATPSRQQGLQAAYPSTTTTTTTTTATTLTPATPSPMGHRHRSNQPHQQQMQHDGTAPRRSHSSTQSPNPPELARPGTPSSHHATAAALAASGGLRNNASLLCQEAPRDTDRLRRHEEGVRNAYLDTPYLSAQYAITPSHPSSRLHHKRHTHSKRTASDSNSNSSTSSTGKNVILGHKSAKISSDSSSNSKSKTILNKRNKSGEGGGSWSGRKSWKSTSRSRSRTRSSSRSRSKSKSRSKSSASESASRSRSRGKRKHKRRRPPATDGHGKQRHSRQPCAFDEMQSPNAPLLPIHSHSLSPESHMRSQMGIPLNPVVPPFHMLSTPKWQVNKRNTSVYAPTFNSMQLSSPAPPNLHAAHQAYGTPYFPMSHLLTAANPVTPMHSMIYPATPASTPRHRHKHHHKHESKALNSPYQAASVPYTPVGYGPGDRRQQVGVPLSVGKRHSSSNISVAEPPHTAPSRKKTSHHHRISDQNETLPPHAPEYQGTGIRITPPSPHLPVPVTPTQPSGVSTFVPIPPFLNTQSKSPSPSLPTEILSDAVSNTNKVVNSEEASTTLNITSSTTSNLPPTATGPASSQNSQETISTQLAPSHIKSKKSSSSTSSSTSTISTNPPATPQFSTPTSSATAVEALTSTAEQNPSPTGVLNDKVSPNTSPSLSGSAAKIGSSEPSTSAAKKAIDFESYDDMFDDLPLGTANFFNKARVMQNVQENLSDDEPDFGDSSASGSESESTTTGFSDSTSEIGSEKQTEDKKKKTRKLQHTKSVPADMDKLTGPKFLELRDYASNKFMEIGSVTATAAQNRTQLNLLFNPRFARALFEILGAKQQQINTAFKQTLITEEDCKHLIQSLDSARCEIARMAKINTLKAIDLFIHPHKFTSSLLQQNWMLMKKEMNSYHEVYNTDNYLKLCILEAVDSHIRHLRVQLIKTVVRERPSLAQWIVTAWVGIQAVNKMSFKQLMKQTHFLYDLLSSLDEYTDCISLRQKPMLLVRSAVTEWRVSLELLDSLVHRNKPVKPPRPSLH
ncbi:hypothetical protein Pelo_3083 [Pelomyxa schiedti]|nr:hypothetical protein Pelo_3083 [Pelomyxa schiedti]